MRMQALFVNHDLETALVDLQELTEVRDAEGNLLGFYMPTSFHRNVSSFNQVEIHNARKPGEVSVSR